MKRIDTIGVQEDALQYADRPTVKVLITRGNDVLVLNKGLLPGGGVEPGETNEQAIERELLEELGVTVENVQEVGEVIQYRNYVQKKYIIHGYVAELVAFDTTPSAQDAGEATFQQHWMTKEDAIKYVSEYIATVEKVVMLGDAIQGLLYNLKTTLAFLKNT